MNRLTAFVYSVAFALAMPLLVWRLLRSPGKAGFAQRFGFELGRTGTPCLWLHASSVGEVALLEPLVAAIERRLPDAQLLITAFTPTGIASARRRFPAHRVCAFPFDMAFVVRRFLKRFRPRLVVIVESEFWPRFLTELQRRAIPVAVLNGKMSERSALVHRRTRFVAEALRSADVVAMQDEANAARMRSVGVAAERIHVTGNMKYDLVSELERVPSRAAYGIADAAFVVVAGSLHGGEERVFLDAVFSPGPVADATAALIAPRYPETAQKIAAQARGRGLRTVLSSSLRHIRAESGSWDVCVVDTIGELRGLYALADAVLVGGSLYFRGSTRGGHNLMEPAICGVPVFFGPWNYSFAEIARELERAGGGREVRDAEQLRLALGEVARDSALAARMGQAARRVVLAGQGAAARNIDLVFGLLERGTH
jgi:3-deoxy-D-manno-octulosonic-acid transferase